MKSTENFISAAVIAVVVPLVLEWLARSARAKAKTKDGILWLEYSKVMKGLTFFFIAIVAVLIAAWLGAAAKDKNPILGLIALFGGLTLPLAIETMFVRIGFDAERIFCHSGWRTKRVVEWHDVETARFSPSMKWWVINTRNSGAIRASMYLTGINELLVALESRGKKDA
jgi:hypothetical protein